MLAPRGPIKVIRVGRAVRIPMAAVQEWMHDEMEASREGRIDNRNIR